MINALGGDPPPRENRIIENVEKQSRQEKDLDVELDAENDKYCRSSEEWPFYKSPPGFRLIDIDFRVSFNAGDELPTKWTTCFKIIMSFLSNDNHVKNKYTKSNRICDEEKEL
ncbi:hypothetical protein JTB14_036970 [Gonioctena quinquepunctata]|nr:hypothetical protein JTB14_036970 [Gonioctena quinquepunctata]